jgi:hypothetical protein
MVSNEFERTLSSQTIFRRVSSQVTTSFIIQAIRVKVGLFVPDLLNFFH